MTQKFINKCKDTLNYSSNFFRHIFKKHRVGVVIVLAFFVVLSVIYHRAPAVISSLPNDTYITNGTVNTIAVDPTIHTTYLGGDFSYVGPNTGQGVSISTSTGLVQAPFLKINGTVNSSISDGSGGWYIGGNFTSIGVVVRNYIAHIKSDGTLDTNWDPNAGSIVYSMVLSGSTLYVGGDFTGIGGQPRSFIAALDTTTGLATDWNPSATGDIFSLALSGPTLYVGGDFTGIGSQVRNRIAALNTSDGLATAWDPNADGGIKTFILSGDNSTLYVGGYFTSIGSQPRNYIAALDTTTGLAIDWNPNAAGGVETIVLSGSTLYVGGTFSNIGGQDRNYIAALDTTTGLATSWNPNVSFSFTWTPPAKGGAKPARKNPSVNTLVLSDSDTTLYVGGTFSNIGGQDRNYIAALNTSDGLATAWDPSASDTIYTLSLSGSTLFTGGDFVSMGGQNRSYLASLDSNGVITAWNPSSDNVVNTLVLSGSTLYAGGYFNNIGGQDRNLIAALDTTTGLATAWDPNATYGGGRAKAGQSLFGIITLSLSGTGSTLYAGGYFNNIGGQARNYIAALDTTTGLATAWDPSADDVINTLALSGSTLYAGGSFSNIGGQDRNFIAALNTTTGLATSWDPSATYNRAQQKGGPTPGILTLAISGSTLFTGGLFTNIGGQVRNFIAAINTTTGLATDWDLNIDDSANTITISDINLYVGGSFTFMGLQKQPSFAKFSGIELVVVISAPNTPTTVIGSSINASEETTGFDVAVGLGTSGASAGDTLELLLGGVSFGTPLTHVLTSGEITAGTYAFNIAHGQLGSDGTKNITAKVNTGSVSSILVLNLNTVAVNVASDSSLTTTPVTPPTTSAPVVTTTPAPITTPVITPVPEKTTSATSTAKTTTTTTLKNNSNIIIISQPGCTVFKQSPQTFFNRNLSYGSKGKDVQDLQVYLNNHCFPVVLKAYGSKGQETAFFGPFTRAAVIKLQEAYASEILKPYGLTQGTGNFGIMTRKFVNSHQ